MKLGGRGAVIAAVFFALVFFVIHKTGPWSAGFRPAGAQGAKTLILQPSYPGYQIVEAAFNDVSAQCLACHGPSYEDLRAKTANYTTANYGYNGEYIQPHVYLSFSTGNHASTEGPNCLECHAPHELPVPGPAVKKVNLDYCLGCHHQGDLVNCSECH
jgi:predicted CXXCH cytochrome family protein